MTVYEPRGGARELLLSREPTVLMSGPAGTGKTVAALFKIHITSLMVPDCVTLVLRARHNSLTASTLRTYEQFVAQQEIASGDVVWFGGSGSKPAAYRYRNGSLIIPGGMDQPGKFLSMDVQRVLIDECNQVSRVGVETVQTRLRGKAATYRQAVLLTNPDNPEHHLLKMAAGGRAWHITSVHRDNPYLFHADGTPTPDGVDYMARLDGLTGVQRARYRDGLWLAAEGAVWPGWQDAVHVVDPFEVPADGTWRFIESVDFGYQHPMTWGRFAVDPGGRMFLVSEMSRRHRLVEDFAADILEVRKSNGWSLPEALVTDHAAGDRATLERHLGGPTVKARKDVGPGIQAVAARLAVQPDGQPRLRVFRNALIRNDTLAATDGLPRGFAAEVPGYVWSMSRGADGIPREAPLKVNDDSCLIAGTPVATARGPVAIEHVRPGDMVDTRGGTRPVVYCGMTSQSAVVFRVALSDGSSLTGTGNHPVWVAGVGWRRIDALGYADRLLRRSAVGQPSSTPLGSRPTGTAAPGAAAPGAAGASVRVLCVTRARDPQPVYNLSVADTHEYFASGVLVHNCDMVRYAVMHIDGAPPVKVGNPARPPSGQPRQGSKWGVPTGRPQ